MAAKGTKAKQRIKEQLQTLFGANYLGERDNKIYIQVQDDGAEMVQIAISLTCPKVPVEAVNVSYDDRIDFEAELTLMPTGFTPAEFTQDERDMVAKLVAAL